MTRRLTPKLAALGLTTLLLSGGALAAPTLEALQQQIDALAAELEAQKSAASGHGSDGGKTTLGGYGEHHYNNLDSNLGKKNEVDAHRFVLFVGHRFDDNIRFFSELEVEHGLVKDNGDATCTVNNSLGTDPLVLEPGEVVCTSSKGAGPGEVELEQAFIEVRINDALRVTAGQFLLPVGFLNETHEPDTFYGVERNPVENAILPTTWWETGVMVSGALGDTLGYDVALHSGLNNAVGNIRSGRQKSAKANANEWAATARIKYHPRNNLELAVTLQQQADMAQRSTARAQQAILASTHFVWQPLPKLTVRGLYGQWEIDNLATLDAARAEQHGFYVETGYKMTPTIGVFARYNQWDNTAADNADSENVQTDVGINWWLHPRVVVKADYQDQAKSADNDGFNLGLGWSF